MTGRSCLRSRNVGVPKALSFVKINISKSFGIDIHTYSCFNYRCYLYFILMFQTLSNADTVSIQRLQNLRLEQWGIPLATHKSEASLRNLITRFLSYSTGAQVASCIRDRIQSSQRSKGGFLGIRRQGQFNSRDESGRCACLLQHVPTISTP